MEQQYVGEPVATRVDIAGDMRTELEERARQWERSGAAVLSGRPDGDPLPVPCGLVRGVESLAEQIAASSATRGHPVVIDGHALLGERAALAGLSRQGAVSCGRAARLLEVEDGTIALSLARPNDVAAVPAWLESAVLPTEPDRLWPAITTLVVRRSKGDLVSRATLLGLPCAAVGEAAEPDRPGVQQSQIGVARRDVREVPLVVDLWSLWAGPLCANLLGAAGCRIVKVESTGRPDGARNGSKDFYDLLHGGHESVALDFDDVAERDALRRLVMLADVVIEGSRPRAFASLGIDRGAIEGPAVWLSITGHGRHGGAADRVAFGDDAAAAGGLVTSDADGPCFCGDAIADPLTGMTGAAAVLEVLADGNVWTIDLALSRVAASFASGPLVAADPVAAAAPRARPIRTVAPVLGADTAAILREFGIRR